MVPVEETTTPPTRPDHLKPQPRGTTRRRSKIGAINEETNVVRVDLTVTNPNDNNARVLTRAQAQVQL